ncbi:ash family protein [Salmonella enterica]|uniref:ash family protein n=1 Tax=Salmonella enterica TaxID=28901 RepID=UPI00209A6E80|nr:ash family protein [Salmonella enterica]
MVAQAGASKEAPGRDNRYANPVWVITSEPGVSGDGVNRLITKRSTAYVSCPDVTHRTCLRRRYL